MEYCWTVEAHWLVAKESKLIVMREQVGVHSIVARKRKNKGSCDVSVEN